MFERHGHYQGAKASERGRSEQSDKAKPDVQATSKPKPEPKVKQWNQLKDTNDARVLA